MPLTTPTTKGVAMTTDRHPLLRRIARAYREFDYVGRRSFELRTGVSVIEPWEHLERSRRP